MSRLSYNDFIELEHISAHIAHLGATILSHKDEIQEKIGWGFDKEGIYHQYYNDYLNNSTSIRTRLYGFYENKKIADSELLVELNKYFSPFEEYVKSLFSDSSQTPIYYTKDSYKEAVYDRCYATYGKEKADEFIKELK